MPGKDGIAIGTAGITLGWAVELTAGTRPTTGYVTLPDLKSTPALDAAPEQLETTTLRATKFKTYIAGLKDLGGALEFGFNYTELLITDWESMLEAYETAAAAGKAMWFEIKSPRLEKSTFFTGEPSPLGTPESGVNAVWEAKGYITVTNEPDRFAKTED